MNISELKVGQTMSNRNWLKIDQDKINQFALATGDHQWIHVDARRCVEESPFGRTIAHGFLSTSLMPICFSEVVDVDPISQTSINYGVETLRFLEPVRSEDEIKYHFELIGIEQKTLGKLYRLNTSVEIKHNSKPALVGEFLVLLIEKNK